jgi:hypothetical protein
VIFRGANANVTEKLVKAGFGSAAIPVEFYDTLEETMQAIIDS